MSMISVRKLWKEYGDQVVLENVSLDVKEHEFVTVNIPSACGGVVYL